MLSTLGKHFRCLGFTREGKFNLPEPEENYTIVSKYATIVIQQILMVLILMRLCYVTTVRSPFGDDAAY
jgi:hypothetical protein